MLLLVRHGESTANVAGRLVGRSDPSLTDHGQRQAAALGTLLGPVTRVISSPLARARQTAEAFGLELPIEIDERWVEVDYGEYEGRRPEELPPGTWQRWRSGETFVPPGGESLSTVFGRVASACSDLFADEGTGARDPLGAVVVVSHVSPIKAAVSWALGVPVALAWKMFLGTGSLTRIGWGESGPTLHAYNLPAPLAPGGPTPA